MHFLAALSQGSLALRIHLHLLGSGSASPWLQHTR